jgi:2-isopropylmalate synthase
MMSTSSMDTGEFRIRGEHAAGGQQRPAETIILCDTNGGSLPERVARSFRPSTSLPATVRVGIHTTTIVNWPSPITRRRIRRDARAGTINGYGERCGNANLCSIIPNLSLKMNYRACPTATFTC